MKFTASLALLFLICSSCTALEELDEEMPRRVEVPRGEDAPAPIELRACRGDFVFGPVWARVRDRGDALSEREWIASLVTTRELLLRDAMAPIDYSKRGSRLQNALDVHDVELIENHDDSFLIVAGRPDQIVRVIESSCDLVGFDLTGFDCGGEPESCAKARECELARARVDVDERDAADAMSALMSHAPSYFAIRGCVDDSGARGHARVDARGVTWSVEE